MSETMTASAPMPHVAAPPGTLHRLGMPHRWTGEEFDRLVEQGFIREGSKTFLWDGEIIEPMAEDEPHINAVFNLFRTFLGRFPDSDWMINTDTPINLMENYRPQPDISVIRGPRSNYRVRKHRPRPENIALLAEVSDIAHLADGGELLRGYARVGIPQYWIVNIRARRIEVYTDPDSEGQSYRVGRDYGLDATVPLTLTVEGVVFPFEPIAVRDVLKDSLDEA